MRPGRGIALLGAAAVLAICWNGWAADRATIQTALIVSTAPSATIVRNEAAAAAHGVAAPAMPRMTASVLSPRLQAPAQGASSGTLGFRGTVQDVGFDLDLAKLYRAAQPSAAVIPLSTEPGAAGRAAALATWDMPLAITPADRKLADRLQSRADRALAAQFAMTDAPAPSR